MLTAIAVLLLSAVGGGMVGAFLTTTYPHDVICEECTEKEIYQEEIRYEQLESELQKQQSQE